MSPKTTMWVSFVTLVLCAVTLVVVWGTQQDLTHSRAQAAIVNAICAGSLTCQNLITMVSVVGIDNDRSVNIDIAGAKTACTRMGGTWKTVKDPDNGALVESCVFADGFTIGFYGT